MHSPLFDCEDDTKVIDVMPPMELHLFTGVFNRIFDIGNEILSSSNCNISLWKEALGFQRPNLHRECFNGNQCSLLLKNLDVLVQIVGSQEPVSETFQNLLDCFKTLQVGW